MWKVLPEENKQKYKKLITNFASLSKAFSQKSETDEENEVKEFVAPIVNSKFQETVFQKAFDAVAEDIANTSYDASLKVSGTSKFLIGIKSFGIASGDQKIAQFKASSEADGWNDILAQVKVNATESISKSEADILNDDLYRELARKIGFLRNERIESSKAQIKGFNAHDIDVDAIYHILMPSKKGSVPTIYVGETDYTPIDIDNLKIIGATSKDKSNNFKFSDGRHTYKYTSADSQLYMKFHNKEIIVDEWSVEYVEDPFVIFENLDKLLLSDVAEEDRSEIEESFSWMIPNKNGEVEESSGYNGFNGGLKLAKDGREKRADNLYKKFYMHVDLPKFEKVMADLRVILNGEWKTKEKKLELDRLRLDLLSEVEKLNNVELAEKIEKTLYRDASEMYIPIPVSRWFHDNNPNFFGPNVGTFQTEKGREKKLALPVDERIFRLEFMPSGDAVQAYINQDDGKGIQSIGKQTILGEWILREVFRLNNRQLLTTKRLNELEINGIRLNKFKDQSRGIGLEFIWIDVDNPPEDAIGWIAEKIKKRVVH